MSIARVHHYGPDPAFPGGMGSVIGVLSRAGAGGESVLSHTTWRPGSRVGNLDLALAAARGLLSLRRSELVHVHLAENGSFLREGAIVLLARMLGHPTVVTIHGSGFVPFAHRHPRLAAAVLGRAHLVTCLDEEVLSLVGRLAPRARRTILPNPVVVEERCPAAEETEEVVLFGGLVGLRKGVDVLCRAWETVAAERPRARCVLAGPAGDYAVPRLPRLEVRGPVGAEEIRRLLRSARVVALPSRAEGMPMILTEAMSAGRPFVSTPVGGIPELARHGGLLVEVEDAAALAARLQELLGDSARAASLGAAGWRYCAETRSVEVIGERLGKLYAEAASRCTRATPSR